MRIELVTYKFLFHVSLIVVVSLTVLNAYVFSQTGGELPSSDKSGNANYLLFGFAVVAVGAIVYLFHKLEVKNKELTEYVKGSSKEFSDVVINNTTVIKDLKDTIVNSIVQSTHK